MDTSSKARKIVIEPVTRIEGHAKITIQLDDAGHVADARFHVAEFRGFESFCVGRPLWEMPSITARVCGICPVSHLMASAKAGDALLAVEIPPAAAKLRRLMNAGQHVQSHALSFFHLSSPDFILGFDSDPAQRNMFGLLKNDADFIRRGVRLRSFGQEIIEILGGRKVHPAWAVPGGVREPLSIAGRDHILERLPEMHQTIRIALDRYKGMMDGLKEASDTFGNFPSLFLGLVGHDGSWETYDGKLLLGDANGHIVLEGPPAEVYHRVVAEQVEPDSYLKSPYFRERGVKDGMYRVGPLARLNLCDRMGTPLADQELVEYRQRGGRTVLSSFWFHYARLIEILAGLEQIERLVQDPTLLGGKLRAEAGVNRLEGVGVSEAPRGTLFHEYHVDERGIMRYVNLVIATGQNNLAMNATMAQIARHFIKGPEIPEGVLNRLEAGIRAYDPCLSCSTHAVGQMALHVRLVGPDGTILDEKIRD